MIAQSTFAGSLFGSSVSISGSVANAAFDGHQLTGAGIVSDVVGSVTGNAVSSLAGIDELIDPLISEAIGTTASNQTKKFLSDDFP